ncbi:MAG: HDOD domain-containing protein [Pseudomonadales bacterium]|nr:HDOD domain-containing protein [Pseudomonadales bacterium]
MSAEFRPKGLETWVYLLDESPIPVLAHTSQALKTLVVGTTDWGLSDIADIMVKDPIMTVHLLRETQRVFAGKAAGTMTDVHHCVSLLGETRVLGLIKQFKAMNGDVNDANEVAYQGAIVQSFHAAAQVEAWHKVRRQSAVDKHVLAAKMAGVPTWCLWYFANKEMSIIDKLQKEERIEKSDAERAVLGCTSQEIVKALAKRWHFPEVILNALNGERLPSAKFLAKVAHEGYHLKEPRIPNKDERGEIVKTSSFIVALAHWLARESDLDWYSRQTRRVLAVLAAYLEIDLHQARLVAQKAALKVSRQFNFPAVEMPGARLLLPPQPAFRRRLSPAKLSNAVEQLSQGKPLHQPEHGQDEPTNIYVAEESTQRQPTTKPEPVAQPLPVAKRTPGFASVEKEKIYKQYVKTLLNDPKAFSDEHEVLRKTMEVLKDCTAVERVVLFVFEPAKKSLRGYAAMGCEDRPEFRKANVSLSPPNFFTQLMRKPQGVWVHPEKKADIAALVPGVFKQLSQADEFFSVSVFNHKQPAAMLYVDNGADDRKSLSEAEFKITKTIANATSKFLIQMGKRALNS